MPGFDMVVGVDGEVRKVLCHMPKMLLMLLCSSFPHVLIVVSVDGVVRKVLCHVPKILLFISMARSRMCVRASTKMDSQI